MWITDGIFLGTTLGTYDGTDIGSSQCSSIGYCKFEVAVYGLEIGTNKVLNQA